DLDPAPATAAELVLQHEDLIAAVDVLLGCQLGLLPGVGVPDLECLPDRLEAVRDVALREAAARAVKLDVRVDEFRHLAPVVPLEGLTHPPDDIHVLMRHPRGVSRTMTAASPDDEPE